MMQMAGQDTDTGQDSPSPPLVQSSLVVLSSHCARITAAVLATYREFRLGPTANQPRRS